MKFYGKAQETAQNILNAFRAGDVPAAMADIFIRWDDDAPCRAWSITNQIAMVIAGHSDARGFRQWQKVDRKVTKGQKSFSILVPLISKIEGENGADDKTRLYGFKTAAVFGYEQTEGKELPGREATRKFCDALPFASVAHKWGLRLDTYNGASKGPRGRYWKGADTAGIALGVENLATWAHELIHAADDRAQLKATGKGLKSGQQLNQEVVAEFGGAVLLEMAGLKSDSDRGGCFEYVKAYAAAEGKEAVSVCMSLLNRVAAAVALVVETAAAIEGGADASLEETSSETNNQQQETPALA